MAGDYAAWNYFQSLSTPQNQEFVQRFQARYGADRVVSDPMEAAYVAVHLWAQAVEAAGTEDTAAVRRNIGDQSYLGPGGMVYVDRTTQHTWKVVRLGRIRADGQFDVVWSSEHPVRPVPYPVYRRKLNGIISSSRSTRAGAGSGRTREVGEEPVSLLQEPADLHAIGIVVPADRAGTIRLRGVLHVQTFRSFPLHAGTNNLVAIAQRQADGIERWVFERERDVAALARSPVVIRGLVDRGPNQEPLQEQFFAYTEGGDYDDAFLVGADGQTVFALHREDLRGINLRSPAYRDTEFAKAFDRAATLIDVDMSTFEILPATGQVAKYLAAPVFHRRRLVGVVLLQANNREITRVVNDYTGLGRTGETVVARLKDREAILWFRRGTILELLSSAICRLKVATCSDLHVVQGRRG